MAPIKFEEIEVGKPFLPETARLTRELIEEYRAVVGDWNPLYDGSSPQADRLAPPTFGSLYLFSVFHNTYPPAPGRLHTSLDFEFLEPWREGDTITVEGSVLDKYVKRGRKYLLFALTFTDQHGVEVARARVEEVTPE